MSKNLGLAVSISTALIAGVLSFGATAQAKTAGEFKDQCGMIAYGAGTNANSKIELNELELYAGPLVPDAKQVCVIGDMGAGFAQITKVDVIAGQVVPMLVEYGLRGNADLYIGKLASPAESRADSMPLIRCDGKKKTWCYAYFDMTGVLELGVQISNGKPVIRSMRTGPDMMVMSTQIRSSLSKVDFDRSVFMVIDPGGEGQKNVAFKPPGELGGTDHLLPAEPTRAVLAWANNQPNESKIGLAYAVKGGEYTSANFNAGNVKLTLRMLDFMLQWPKPE